MLKELRKYISCIYDLCNSIADLDMIFSFVQYSARPKRTRPKFGQCIDIKNSNHPILEIMNSIVLVKNDVVSFIILYECNEVNSYLQIDYKII